MAAVVIVVPILLLGPVTYIVIYRDACRDRGEKPQWGPFLKALVMTELGR